MNEPIILKWVDGKLIVDEGSLHHFGTDIPEGFDTPQGMYSITIKDIHQIQQIVPEGKTMKNMIYAD